MNDKAPAVHDLKASKQVENVAAWVRWGEEAFPALGKDAGPVLRSIVSRWLFEPSGAVRAFVGRHARQHHLTDADAPFVGAHVRWGDKVGKESVQINASE